jgi:hypothetical protein
MDSNRFRAILRTLADRQVGFVVVGGVAAALDGAPLQTFDIDIVHSRDSENLVRLLAALQDLDARYRYRPEFRPDESHLAAAGPQLLLTRFGPLDVLGAIGSGWTCADLLPHSQPIEIAPGLGVRVLDLETIIRIKEELGAGKDLAVLPVLRRTLAEIRRRHDSGE